MIDVHLSPLVEGICIGLVFGIIIGTTWEKAIELIVDAIRERLTRNERKTMTEHQKEPDQDRSRVRRLGFLLAVTSVVMMVTGGSTVYLYSRLDGFVKCQAHYNQESSDARDARLGPSIKENDAFYAWLNTLPPLLAPRPPGTPPAPGTIKAFRVELSTAIQTHMANVVAQKTNPYPPDPQDTCGEY